MRLDDDTYLEISPHSIGEIKLVIHRTTTPKKISKKGLITDFTPLPSGMVHERSKKATAHRVRYVASLTLHNT